MGNEKQRWTQRDTVCLAVFAVCVFVAVSFPVMAFQERAEGGSSLAGPTPVILLRGLLGSFPGFVLFGALAVLFGLGFVLAREIELRRQSLGIFGVGMGLAMAVGAAPESLGAGQLGHSLASLLPGMAGPLLAALLGVGLLSLSVWQVWFPGLGNKGAKPVVSGPISAVLEEASRDGVTPAEAEALMPQARKVAPEQDRLAPTGPKEDIRRQGGVPEGAQPLQTGDEYAQSQRTSEAEQGQRAAGGEAGDAGTLAEDLVVEIPGSDQAQEGRPDSEPAGEASPSSRPLSAGTARSSEARPLQAEESAGAPPAPAWESQAADTEAASAQEPGLDPDGAPDGLFDGVSPSDESLPLAEQAAASTNGRSSATASDGAQDELLEAELDEGSLFDDLASSEQAEEAQAQMDGADAIASQSGLTGVETEDVEELEGEEEEGGEEEAAEERAEDEDEEEEEEEEEEGERAEDEEEDEEEEDAEEEDEEDERAEDEEGEEEEERAEGAEDAVDEEQTVQPVGGPAEPGPEAAGTGGAEAGNVDSPATPDEHQPELFAEAEGEPGASELALDQTQGADEAWPEEEWKESSVAGSEPQEVGETQLELTPVQPPDPEAAPSEPAPAVDYDSEEGWSQLVLDSGRLFVERERVAVSMLQKTFGVDFKIATKVMDELQERGLIGPYMGGTRRDILLSLDEWMARTSST